MSSSPRKAAERAGALHSQAGVYTPRVPLSDTERAVIETLSPRLEEMYAALAEHVAIPTGRDCVAGLDQYRDAVIPRLEALGADVELRSGEPRPAWLLPFEEKDVPFPIVIARRPSSDDSQPAILLAGHMDTVHDPRSPFRELSRSQDGRTATGPGAVDMKGGIVCALFALDALRMNGIDCNWTFVLNADEETGTFQSERVLRELAREHDYGIALEPALADGSLAIERMGSGQFMIEVHGVAAHVGREFEKGRSAVTKLGEVLVALGAMARPEEGIIVNVGPLVGGGATNIVPDYAACRGNVRFRDAAAGEALAAKIDDLAMEETDGVRIVVHRRWNRPAKPRTGDVEDFAQLARQCAIDLGQQLPFASTGGVCDGNILQDEGLPTLDTLGIRGGNLHRTDEFIEIDALVERAQLIALLLMRLSAE